MFPQPVTFAAYSVWIIICHQLHHALLPPCPGSKPGQRGTGSVWEAGGKKVVGGGFPWWWQTGEI